MACIQINVPSFNFFIFSSPRTLLGLPPFLYFKEIDFFTNPSFHFHSLLVLFTPNFHGKMSFMYFSFMIYDNLFCSFRLCTIIESRYSHSAPPPCLLGFPVYLALDSMHRVISSSLVRISINVLYFLFRILLLSLRLKHGFSGITKVKFTPFYRKIKFSNFHTQGCNAFPCTLNCRLANSSFAVYFKL